MWGRRGHAGPSPSPVWPPPPVRRSPLGHSAVTRHHPWWNSPAATGHGALSETGLGGQAPGGDTPALSTAEQLAELLTPSPGHGSRVGLGMRDDSGDNPRTVAAHPMEVAPSPQLWSPGPTGTFRAELEADAPGGSVCRQEPAAAAPLTRSSGRAAGGEQSWQRRPHGDRGATALTQADRPAPREDAPPRPGSPQAG